MEDLTYEIYRWWRKLTSPFRFIKYSIESLIKWFPVISKDRQWDHIYFYIMLETKIGFMIKENREYSNHLHVDKQIRYMVICKNLCARLIEDDYARYHYDKLDKMYGELKMTFSPVPNSKCSRVHIGRPRATEMTRKLSKKCYRLEASLRQHDKDLLFKLLNKHLESWWW